MTEARPVTRRNSGSLLVAFGIALSLWIPSTGSAQLRAAVGVPVAPTIASRLTPTMPADKIDLQARALSYFLENAHPVTGLVRDAAENFEATSSSNRMASIAATGFGLAVISHASTQGLVTRDKARDYALRTLRFARDHVPRRKGWFVHFMDWETGTVITGSEYSTIDTALFLAGALYAGQIFSGTEISEIAQELYRDTDYIDMLTDGGTKPNKLTLSMAYFPDRGYNETQWSMPAEEMLLVLLGLGHPTHPLPDKAWLAWDRKAATLPDGEKLIGADMPLFAHQYSQLFVDFRHFRDLLANYYDNAALASRFNKETCSKDARFKTFKEGFWGLSAGQSPEGYSIYNPMNYVSTVCLGCALGSAMYMPDIVLRDAQKWATGPYAKKIWGRYGFVDSMDVDQNWYSHQVLGITVGPIYMSLANTTERESFWGTFQEIPAVKQALQKARDVRARDHRLAIASLFPM